MLNSKIMGLDSCKLYPVSTSELKVVPDELC